MNYDLIYPKSAYLHRKIIIIRNWKKREMHSTFQRIFDDLIKLRSYKELNTLTLDNSYSQWLILRLSFLYGIFLDRPSYGKWGIIEYRINSKRKWKWKNSPLEGVEYEYLMNIQQILEVEIHFFAKFCRFLEERSKVVISLAVWYVHSIFGLNLMHYSFIFCFYV